MSYTPIPAMRTPSRQPSKKLSRPVICEDLIHVVSIPMETVTEITDNGPKTYDRKVFPGYVLVKMIMTDEAWYIIKNVRGVTGFVGSGTKPTPLTEEEVRQLGVEKHEIVVNFASWRQRQDHRRSSDVVHRRCRRAGRRQKQGPRRLFPCLDAKRRSSWSSIRLKRDPPVNRNGPPMRSERGRGARPRQKYATRVSPHLFRRCLLQWHRK